jgi:hypothetical protein
MRFRAVLFSAFAAVAACGASTTDTCNSFATVWCNQHYTCATGADLAALQAKYGATATQCATTYATLNNCASQALCPPGTSYDTGRSQQCTTEYGQLTCADIQNNTVLSDCNVAGYICH